jgi:hypothetical protein
MGTDLTGIEGDDKKGPARRDRQAAAGLGRGPRPPDCATRKKIIRNVRAAKRARFAALFRL